MTSTRDKIARIVFDHWSPHGPTDKATADAIIAALPDMVPELVWTDPNESNYRHTFSGAYEISHPRTSLFFDASGQLVKLGAYHTIESAKAAANAHHRVQVMQALGLTGKETE